MTTATRKAALGTAVTAPLPRRFRIANYAALVPLVAGMIWVVLYGPDPEWPVGFVYAVGALMLLSLPLSFADEGWARAGAAASRAVYSVIVMTGLLALMVAADAPTWVPLAIYGGLVVIAGSTVAGKVINYQSATRQEGDAPTS